MLSNDFISHIESVVGQPILNASSVSGGDISAAYKISTEHDNFFLKVNTTESALNMFKTEQKGLELIGQTNTLKTPFVYACNSHLNSAYLLLQFIDSKVPNDTDFQTLGKQMALLHKISSERFGLDHDNYIGSLPQYNQQHDDWANFYIEQRLIPQINIAISKGLLLKCDIPEKSQMIKVCMHLFNNIQPTLLHGDLWSGNYLISKDGEPFLIDPAIFYGHHEVDIAMSKLFGGFSNEFYKHYHAHLPKSSRFEERVQLYQLYYLLVHLNIFGRTYYSSVKQLLQHYF